MIKIDISGLQGSIRQTTEMVAGIAPEKVDQAAFAMLNGLQAATPVDTGEARRGWVVEKSETETSIVNNVDYINRLNNGHSKQAPAGFVEAVVDEVTRAMK